MTLGGIEREQTGETGQTVTLSRSWRVLHFHE